MANGGNGNNMTKADMQDVCDQVQDILSEAYTPEASREELAAAIGDALDLLENGPPMTRMTQTTTRTTIQTTRADAG